MEDDLETSLDRLLPALRRLWWVVALGGILGLLLGALVLASPGETGSLRLRVIGNSAPLVAAEMPPDIVTLDVGIGAASRAISMDSFRHEVSASIGEPLRASVSSEPNNIVNVRLRAETKDGIDAAKTAYLDRFTEVYQAQLALQADSIKAVLASRADLLTERLGELLDANGDLRSNDAATLTEFSLLLRDISETQTQLDGVEEFRSNLTLSIARLDDSTDVSTTRGRVVYGVGGLLVGMALAVAGVYTRSSTDRTIRSRRSIEQFAAAPVVGVLSRAESAAELTALAVAAARLADAGDVQLVSVDGRVDSGRLAAAMGEHRPDTPGSASIIAAPSLAESAGAVVAAHSTGASLLLARWGKTHEDDLIRALHTIEGAGGGRVGIVVTGVPQSLMRSTSV